MMHIGASDPFAGNRVIAGRATDRVKTVAAAMPCRAVRRVPVEANCGKGLTSRLPQLSPLFLFAVLRPYLGARPFTPAARAGAARAPGQLGDVPVTSTIALVDDDRNILTSVSMALEAEGFAVRCYSDGAEALKGLTAQPVDLAVLDIKMPRMDGMELLEPAAPAEPRSR